MNTQNQSKESLNTGKTIENCFGACEKLLQQLRETKNKLVAEFRDAFAAQQEMLRLAIVEADALAWQTEYPHLLFPQLAMEKIQTATQWQERQQRLLQQTAHALAA